MPAKDELARRRHEKLVDRLESMMRAAPNLEYEGYYGQLILGAEDLAEMGELRDVRRAAREAGQRLSWKTTRLVGGSSSSTSARCPRGSPRTSRGRRGGPPQGRPRSTLDTSRTIPWGPVGLPWRSGPLARCRCR